MSNHLIALLKLYEILNIPIKVSTVDDRILLQKSVYLAKKFNYDLGFCFAWYVQGPYSPELTTDMYELYNDLNEIRREGDKYNVQPYLLTQLNNLLYLMVVPPNVCLSKPQWLKLVSSIIYLNQDYKTIDNIKEYLSKCKYFDKHLIQYCDIAFNQINKYL